MKKNILRWFLLIGLTILSGFGLITLIYLVNGDGLAENLQKSQEQMRQQGEFEKVGKLSNSTLDNFTDSIMILTASYEGEKSVVENAMSNTRLSADRKSPYGTLIGSLNGDDITTENYSRYWHGYLVFLRPLLSVFDYSQIRILNCILQGVLLIALIIQLFKKKLGFCIIPFLSAYLLINPPTIAISLQYSTVWYLVLISMLAYLIFKDKIIENKVHYMFFTFVGMLTSYFDLLTYPIATLGMVLILMLVAEDLNWKESIKRILICGTSWVLGFSIMWAAKWVIASIVLNENVINNASEAMQSRGSMTLVSGRKITLIECFKIIFMKFGNSLTYWIVAVNVFVCVINSIFSKIKEKKGFKELSKWDRKKQLKKKNMEARRGNTLVKCILNVLPILALTLMPIVWYIILPAHSYSHAFFAYRTAIVLWFAIFIAIFKLTRDLKTKAS